jgi:glutamate-1-semialdehyde 2,1-aminomutase
MSETAPRPRSAALLERAERLMPGGVNSPVRAFRAVGGNPPFIASAEGAYLTDEDGNRYVDYVGTWGPAILGHAHPAVVEAVQTAAARGMSFGAPTAAEVEMAERVADFFPSMEMLRMVNSGTEATLSALRLARGFTGRDGIVKFEGNYHGHSDSLLVKAGSGAVTFGEPDSAGVPADLARHTITLAYNDADALRALFEARGDALACVILEPVCGNMGVIPPEPAFLEALVEVTKAHGALLIFDEVMTGFRVARGGAQERFGVKPDLTCLGKIVGGGLPVGAYGGRADVMSKISPLGPVYQAGTLSGNPLGMAAGLATLAAIDADAGFYQRLESLTAGLCAGLREIAESKGVPVQVQQVGSMFTLFFSEAPVRDFESAQAADHARFGRYHRAMLAEGIYLPPSGYEACFVSARHGEAEVEATLAAARRAIEV